MIATQLVFILILPHENSRIYINFLAYTYMYYVVFFAVSAFPIG